MKAFHIKVIAKLALVAGILFNVSAFAQEAEAIFKAEEVAQRWLVIVDSGEYSQSWEQSAASFQTKVPKSNWESSILVARSAIGPLKARTLKSVTFTKSLPGAPDGEYVVIQYDSQFANKASAIETAVPMREKDGSWKISGYFIK